MTPGIALYEFLPYGAPDLHASARRNMSLAMALSSGLMLALFFVCLVVVPRLGEPDLVEIPSRGPDRVVDLSDLQVEPPPPLEPTEPPSAPVSKVADGLAVPVSDNTVDPEVTIPSRTPAGPMQSGPGGGKRTASGVESEVPPEALPRPGDNVYVEELPEPIVRVEPTYPELALDARVQGTVVALLLVGKDGRVLDVIIKPEHSIPLLDEAAEEAARRWVFTPALANGRPVIVWVGVPFRFELQ